MAYVPNDLEPVEQRAPTQQRWDAMSVEERRRLVDSLPSEIQRAEPPEGDRHRLPKQRAMEALDEYFRRKGRKVYLSAELPVYYPDEPVFAPDLLAVVDVETHERDRWVVSAEGRGLDFVLEILLSGDRRKDLEYNVARYARLAIAEYFVFEPRRKRLVGYRLASEGRYQAIIPQRGQWSSSVLGLELSLDNGQLRFYSDTLPLPDARELIERLGSLVDDAVERAEEEARRAEAEALRAQEEALRAERYAAKLRELGIDPDSLD